MRAVLVVDSSVAAHVLGACCAEEGLEPLVLPSGTPDLLDRILAEQPALVVVRRVLDKVDGGDLCRSIRAHPLMRPVRVLIVSANASGEADARAFGAHHFLRLPFRAEDGRVAVRTALEARPRLLVVDDSRAQRRAVVPALRAERWEVIEAEDGVEALERLRAFGVVDVVVSDVEMPRMDGITLCATLHTDPATAGIPVILVTSLDSQESIARGFEAGAVDYLTKPVVLSELVARIVRLLCSRASPRVERVLAVDPDIGRARTVEEVLSTHGFSVTVAKDSAAARAVLDARPPQLVVADVDLGTEDGIAFARSLRDDDRFADIPFVLVTGRGTRAQEVHAASAGIQSVVARPYAPDRLLAEVERVLGEARVRRQQTLLRRYLSGAAFTAMTRLVEGDEAPQSRAAHVHRTILFADLAGFTTLSETHRPSEVVAILNTYFDAVVPVFVRHGASIDKLIGDCVMAVFDGEGEGARGAALSALEVLRDTLPALRAESGLDLHVRIGINSGLVIVGDVGSRHFRRDFTVIGDVVNVAQRIQSSANIDEALVGEGTHALLGDGCAFGPGRELRLKGRAIEEWVWPLTGRSAGGG